MEQCRSFGVVDERHTRHSPASRDALRPGCAPPRYRAFFSTLLSSLGTTAPMTRCLAMNEDQRQSSLSPEIDTEGVSPIGYVSLAALIVLVGVMGIFVLTASV